MRTNAEGVALIKHFEGCSLTAYQDQGGKWTIGWGCANGVRPGDMITQEAADARLMADIDFVEGMLVNCLPGIELTENQLSALVSFCYNVGFGCKGARDGFKILASGRPSTMLRHLLAADFVAAAAEFPKWDHLNGAQIAGLLARRQAEKALFLK